MSICDIRALFINKRECFLAIKMLLLLGLLAVFLAGVVLFDAAAPRISSVRVSIKLKSGGETRSFSRLVSLDIPTPAVPMQVLP